MGKTQKRVRVQSGEDQSSFRARYSQDGRWLFVCAGNAVKVYSTVSHELAHVLSRHETLVTSCLINPANTLQLLTASLDGKVVVWDYADGSLLREIEFGVPLFGFALRPGNKEPQVFFEIEKGAMEVDPSEGIAATNGDKVVVGVSSDVILQRNPAVSPGNQLAQATEYLELGADASEICFSHDGEFVVSYAGKSLVVCNITKRRPRSFQTSYLITAIACHPSELCVATGNHRGEIELWWSWSHRTKLPLTTKMHWHAHAVSDLCFTSDGTYLLSGGEECVLVVWQLPSCKAHYRPRLGAQITRIACAPTDQNFAISLLNNIIQVVSGLDDSVEWSVGGLRRAHTQDPKENGMRTGLVWDPRSLSIVANSNPGSLQWYRPDVDLVTSQLDVTGLNYVSRRNDPFVIMTVEHAAFSSDGKWLATVEWRDDGKTTPELRLKFWQFDNSSQEYELNTCIEPPHSEKVTSLAFQPPPSNQTASRKQRKQSTEPLASLPMPVALCVSTSEDGKFKSWVLVDEEREGEEGEGEGERKREPSWACRSVGYYHSLPSRGACFSQDGSLLAVNFQKCLTLWDPYMCEFRKDFISPFPPETFTRHTFGNNASSHYLLAISEHHLIVWDLLSCSVIWCVGADVDVLVADPTGPLAAAFLPSKHGTTHLYRFNPSSPTPVSVWESVCSGTVSSAVYAAHANTAREGCERGEEDGRRKQEEETATLYFQTSTQVLYRVYNEGEDPVINTITSEGMMGGKREEQSRQAYFEVFGEAKKGELELQTSEDTYISQSVIHKNRLRILDAAPHTLPPLTSLSALFLHSLLPSQKRSKSIDIGSDGEQEREEEEEEGERGREGESDSDTDPSEHSKTEKTSEPHPPPPVADMDTGDIVTELTVADFDWLTSEHFGVQSK